VENEGEGNLETVGSCMRGWGNRMRSRRRGCSYDAEKQPHLIWSSMFMVFFSLKPMLLYGSHLNREEACLMRHWRCCHIWGSNTCLTFWVMK